VLVFLNRSAPRLIASSSFDLSGQASVAAGPVGRNLSAETDYKLSAEIYSYSKTKGLFAGINLAATEWEIDAKANKAVYGERQGSDVRRLLGRSGTGGPSWSSRSCGACRRTSSLRSPGSAEVQAQPQRTAGWIGVLPDIA
jgi:lipid-binding SYLF domain-containing protein